MKKRILSLTLLAAFGITQGQNAFQVDAEYASVDDFEVSTTVEALNTLTIEDVPVYNAEESEYEESPLDINIEYLDEVQSSSTPNTIRKYQLMASLYDVSESYVFDGRNDPFQVVFNTEKGTIMTSYDWSGKVLSSEEKFRNVALPNELVRKALKGHEGWSVIRTNYYVSYERGSDAKKVYTVQISDGKKKKKISMDAEGTII